MTGLSASEWRLRVADGSGVGGIWGGWETEETIHSSGLGGVVVLFQFVWRSVVMFLNKKTPKPRQNTAQRTNAFIPERRVCYLLKRENVSVLLGHGRIPLVRDYKFQNTFHCLMDDSWETCWPNWCWTRLLLLVRDELNGRLLTMCPNSWPLPLAHTRLPLIAWDVFCLSVCHKLSWTL